jgi:beta-galactosidase
VHYYLNYSSDPQTFTYSYGTGTELLTQAGVAQSQKTTIKPWDLILIEEK